MNYQQRAIPEEMPDPKEQEKKEVSIIPAPKINPEEEDNHRKNNGYILENRLEFIGLPTVVLPGRKSRRTLDKWVKKYMRQYSETRGGFLVYFDEEPAHDGEVDGYIVELCSKYRKYDFQFRNRYYKVDNHKFDEIEGAESTFYDVLDNMPELQDNIKRTNGKLEKLFGYKNNKKR